VDRVLIDAPTIGQRVAELGAQISADYQGETLIVITLLKGSVVFAVDLMRHIELPLHLEVMRASSYGDSTESSGSVKILTDLDAEIKGRHVLVLEDIVDTGRTLHKTLKLLAFRNPQSLKVCTLLDKPSRRELDIPIAYRGFEIEDHFVVGYGLDYAEYYRNLPYIGVLTL
jgi:hypoxanthine phosphoribosyltransferase